MKKGQFWKISPPPCLRGLSFRLSVTETSPNVSSLSLSLLFPPLFFSLFLGFTVGKVNQATEEASKNQKEIARVFPVCVCVCVRVCIG